MVRAWPRRRSVTASPGRQSMTVAVRPRAARAGSAEASDLLGQTLDLGAGLRVAGGGSLMLAALRADGAVEGCVGAPLSAL